ncbi:MAG: hypothetical protein M1376_15560 [Planctomycetes bacterium]|nr:hypothetical protein [Planctomycetota bacterium]
MGIGRPPSPQKPRRRTFYLPTPLADAFVHEMGKSSSRGVAGGMIFFLGATRTMRQDLMDLAHRLPPAEAAREVRRRLPEWLAEILEVQEIAGLTPKERARLIRVRRKQSAGRGH